MSEPRPVYQPKCYRCGKSLLDGGFITPIGEDFCLECAPAVLREYYGEGTQPA